MTFNIGGWNEADEKEFFTTSDNSNINFDSPNFYRNINIMMANRKKEEYEKEEITTASYVVKVDAVDNINKSEEVTIIKINALAADLLVLKGCKNKILESKPTIIMEYGVRPDYMTEEIIWLTELEPEYKIYMRQKNIFGDCKTILYAIYDK